MKHFITKLIVFSFLIALLSPTIIFAFPNLIQNGDFEDGLNNWTSGGYVNAVDYNFPIYYSPSGDGSYFASLISTNQAPNPYLRQTIDMTATSFYRLTLDFTIATFEPSWSDDFRAQISINYPGGGPFHPIYSYGTGSGLLTEPDPINHPGLRDYTVQGFTYDFFWDNPDDDLVLDFLVLGYNADAYESAMFLDNMSLTAIPEPTTITLLLLGLGLTGTGIYRRKKSLK